MRHITLPQKMICIVNDWWRVFTLFRCIIGLWSTEPVTNMYNSIRGPVCNKVPSWRFNLNFFYHLILICTRRLTLPIMVQHNLSPSLSLHCVPHLTSHNTARRTGFVRRIILYQQAGKNSQWRGGKKEEEKKTNSDKHIQEVTVEIDGFSFSPQQALAAPSNMDQCHRKWLVELKPNICSVCSAKSQFYSLSHYRHGAGPQQMWPTLRELSLRTTTLILFPGSESTTRG